MIVKAVLNQMEMEAFKVYSDRSAPLFKNAGGLPVAKYKIEQQIVGDEDLHIVVVMQFPDKQSIEDIFESEAYKNLLPYRDKAFTQLEVYIGR